MERKDDVLQGTPAVKENTEAQYPKNFFELFGSGGNLGLDDEPDELSFADDSKRLEP